MSFKNYFFKYIINPIIRNIKINNPINSFWLNPKNIILSLGGFCVGCVSVGVGGCGIGVGVGVCVVCRLLLFTWSLVDKELLDILQTVFTLSKDYFNSPYALVVPPITFWQIFKTTFFFVDWLILSVK